MDVNGTTLSETISLKKSHAIRFPLCKLSQNNKGKEMKNRHRDPSRGRGGWLHRGSIKEVFVVTEDICILIVVTWIYIGQNDTEPHTHRTIVDLRVLMSSCNHVRCNQGDRMGERHVGGRHRLSPIFKTSFASIMTSKWKLKTKSWRGCNAFKKQHLAGTAVLSKDTGTDLRLLVQPT